MEDKKAAAEARRQRILAKGRERLAQITGTTPSEPAPASRESSGVLEANLRSLQPVFKSDNIKFEPPHSEEVAQRSNQGTTSLDAATATNTNKEDRSNAASEVPIYTHQRKGGTAATKQSWNCSSNDTPCQPDFGRGPRLECPADLLAAAISWSRPARLVMAVALAIMTIVCTVAGASPGTHSDAATTRFEQLVHAALAGWARQLQYVPPLYTLALLDVGLVWAAYQFMMAQPSLAGSKLATSSPTILLRLAAIVPGLADTLQLVSAAQGAITSMMDDASVFIVTLVIGNLAPEAFGHT